MADSPSKPAQDTTPYRYRGFVLLLLTLIYAFNFIDRQIIGILSPFIQADLELTNSQMGLLKGFLFALFYTVVGIPIAWLADRYNRVNIVTISLAVWSGFTALTGMANSFLSIGLARMGVGVGEAGGSPPSHSIISDMYSKDERTKALSIYSLGIPLGLGFAYAVAGYALGGGGGFNWRQLLIVLGVTGVALAIFTRFVVREPVRGAQDTQDYKQEGVPPFSKLLLSILTGKFFWFGLILLGALVAIYVFTSVLIGILVTIPIVGAGIRAVLKADTPFSATLRVLLSIPSWWYMCLGISLASFVGYAVSAWQIDYLLPFDTAQGDAAFGFSNMMYILALINMFFYGGGTFFGGALAQKLAGKSVSYYALVPALSVLICLPLIIGAFWVPTTMLHMAFAAVLLFFLGMYLGPSFAIAQTLAPINMRAMSTALFFLILNLIALGGGPTAVGFIADAFKETHGQIHAIRLAITICAGALALSALSFFIATKTLPKDWAEAEARNAAG